MNKFKVIFLSFILLLTLVECVQAQILKKIYTKELDIRIPVFIKDGWSLIHYYVEDDAFYILESRANKVKKMPLSFFHTIHEYDLTQKAEMKKIQLYSVPDRIEDYIVCDSNFLVITSQRIYVINKINFVVSEKILNTISTDSHYSLIIDKDTSRTYLYTCEYISGIWRKQIRTLNKKTVFDKKTTSDYYPPSIKNGKVYYFGNIDWFPKQGSPNKELMVYDIYSKKEHGTGIIIPYQFMSFFLSNNLLFCQSNNEVYCYDITTNKLIWSQSFSLFDKIIKPDRVASKIYSELNDNYFDFIIDNTGKVIFSNKFCLMCIERNTGTILWTFVPINILNKIKQNKKISTSYDRFYYINSLTDNQKTRLVLFDNAIIDCNSGKVLMKVGLKDVGAIKTSKNKLFIFTINKKSRNLQVDIFSYN